MTSMCVCALIKIPIGSQVKFAVTVTRYIVKHHKCTVRCIPTVP